MRSEADAFADAVEAAVDAHIADAERAARVRAHVAELRSTLAAFHDDLAALRHDWRDLNTDYDSSREQFDALAARARSSRLRHGRSLTDVAMRVREAVDAAEWVAMYEDVEAAIATQWDEPASPGNEED